MAKDIDKETDSNKSIKSWKFPKSSALPAILLFIIAGGLGFYGGVAYQKDIQRSANKAQALSQNNPNSTPGFMSRGFNRRGLIGKVMTINSTSISVQNQRDNSITTLTIDGNTKVINNGQTAAVSDIKVGDNVAVRANPTNSNLAAQIMLNPNFFGPSSANPTSPDSNSSVQTN